MPAATRHRASSPAQVDEEMEDQELGDGVAVLQFNKALTWKAGKPIAVAELLKRLEALSRELQTYEQDEVDKASMHQVAGELASQQLLSHKDRGVKAYAACCLVDIFRLCAPDAPYTAPQLKDIFTLFIQTVFPALADPSSTYNGQHLYVLKSLAEVKSVLLLLDAPNSAGLTEVLFKQCFDVLGGPTKSNSGEELSKNVEHHMTSILSTLVDESPNLAGEVVETILAQFLRTNPKVAVNSTGRGKKSQPAEGTQATLTLKEAPPAYNMATNVCNSSPDKMSRYVARYVNNILLDASTTASEIAVSGKKSKKRAADELDDSDDEVANGIANLGQTKRAHELLRELWRSCPAILQELIPQQLEPELSAANVDLRCLAVETVADMISGIGHAGPPPSTTLNPAAYPSQSLLEPSAKQTAYNFLTTPSSPVSFISRYYQTYQEFLNRRNDKSAIIRAAWVTSAGRIIMTSAGGVGLDSDEEEKLLKYFAILLVDMDEKVRYNAIKAIERFDFDDIIEKLGSMGGIDEPGSILSYLAQRVKDKKQLVRNESIKLLAKIWGVASGTIAAGSERANRLLGAIPSTILDACYVNDAEIHALVDRVLYESLLPISYPPIKSKVQSNGTSQRVKDSQATTNDDTEPDPDKLRVERFLLLVRGLDAKAKGVLFPKLAQQSQLAQYMHYLLQYCEEYNGGVIDSDDDKKIKSLLTKFIGFWSGRLPEPAKVQEDLWKFAKMHDRRSYQLIRFCTAADSDYRKVQKSIRELSKRIEDASTATATLLDTITMMLYPCSILLYNRSHVPAIIGYSRTNENGLGATAHEILKEISKHKSEVFKAHVQDLCKSLESEAPSAKKSNNPGAVDDLKACAEFARKFPDDVPKERKFLQAMLAFVANGTPPKAAKYGVLIIMTTTDKKDMYAKDIFKQCTDGFEYGTGNYLARLAALSQLMLLGHQFLEESETDKIVDIAINQVLTNAEATPAPEEGEPDPAWLENPDDNCAAKIWALKILVNRLRGYAEDDPVIDDATKPVFQFLNTLVQKHGQITRSSPSPAAHQSRLRLVASQLLLKLCCEKRFNSRLQTTAFNALATVAMDSNEHVRAGFVDKIMKYIGQNKLAFRFYTPLFLLGHEPDWSIRERATTWLRSRAAAFARSKDTSMEAVFARLISLLAHHPDWPSNEEVDEAEKIDTLKMFMGFIIFYLKCVATKDNISLIYHVAQRIKAVQDGITKPGRDGTHEVMNERLYMLSDLSQEVIRSYEEQHGWNIQAWPGKVNMPGAIFSLMPDHETAQRVAMKQYLPEHLVKDMDALVKDALRNKKRKAVDPEARAKKRAKASTSAGADKKVRKIAKPSIKTPKKRLAGREFSSEAPSSEPTRKSSRAANQRSYIEVSDEDEIDSDEQIAEDEDEDMVDSSVGADEEEEEEVAAEEEEVEPEPVPTRSSPKKKATPRKLNGTTPAKTNGSSAKSTPATAAKANGKATKSSPPIAAKTNGTATKAKASKLKTEPAPVTRTNGRPSRGAAKEKAVEEMDLDSDNNDEVVEKEVEEEEVVPAKSKGKAKAKGKAVADVKAAAPVKPTTPKAKPTPAAKVNGKGKATRGRGKKSKEDVFDVPDSE